MQNYKFFGGVAIIKYVKSALMVISYTLLPKMPTI